VLAAIAPRANSAAAAGNERTCPTRNGFAQKTQGASQVGFPGNSAGRTLRPQVALGVEQISCAPSRTSAANPNRCASLIAARRATTVRAGSACP